MSGCVLSLFCFSKMISQVFILSSKGDQLIYKDCILNFFHNNKKMLIYCMHPPKLFFRRPQIIYLYRQSVVANCMYTTRCH